MKYRKKTTKTLRLIDKIILGLNIIAAAALLLSYLAPTTDPRDISFIAILGFGYQFLLIANLLCIIYWLIVKKLFTIISLFSMLLGFNIITDNFGFRSETLPLVKIPGAVRILAYNVHEFKGTGVREEEPTQDKIFEVISDKQPDVIAFGEYTTKKTDKGAVTNSLTNTYGYKYHYYEAYDLRQHDSVGVAIFSKYPIKSSGMVSSGKILNTQAVYADISIAQKTFRLYCIHLAAVKMKGSDKSKVLSGTINLEKSSFITNKLTSAFIQRSYQVSQIKEQTEKCPYPYVIAGDLNDTPISYAVNELSEGMQNAAIEKGSGLINTYYTTFPKLQIDYILASPQFDILNYQAIDKKISDHKPIVSDVKFN